ncbi:tumor necrosis factor ligand superfamily member 18 [Sebastes fasciatus]|uniref:tumor necrosis factor ligand superfamily member 18 n=1 Tax=Sebastes fasciatus TaxID=394691 RepID=UPI003D9F5DFB
MPQQTQHSLIHVFLLWITILSIVQIVFIILFFTAGHHGLSQNSSAVAPDRQMHSTESKTPSSPSEHGLLLGEGKMMTFEAAQGKGIIRWIAKNEDKGLISGEGGLKILTDGYFFLNLQVTLDKCNGSSQDIVSLKKDDKLILLGRINVKTCSTGLLGKVEELSAGSHLVVNLPTENINITLTHLDIIYMYKKSL